MFGRVLRLLAGKTHGIIIDHVGNVARHGLPDSPRQWSLEPRSKRSSNNDDDAIPVKVCPECTFVYERFRKACPDCGHIPVPASRTTIEHVDGDLTELDPAILAEMRGEIDNVGLDIDVQAMEYKRQLQLKRCPDIALNKHVKHMIGKLQHQKSSQIILRDKMAWWAGHRRSEGRSDDELFKIFYLKYGVDWLTAQTLSGVESDELIKRIGAVEQ
jgi:DNA repair protein RadD